MYFLQRIYLQCTHLQFISKKSHEINKVLMKQFLLSIPLHSITKKRKPLNYDTQNVIIYCQWAVFVSDLCLDTAQVFRIWWSKQDGRTEFCKFWLFIKFPEVIKDRSVKVDILSTGNRIWISAAGRLHGSRFALATAWRSKVCLNKVQINIH